jgi:hypothetical protein
MNKKIDELTKMHDEQISKLTIQLDLLKTHKKEDFYQKIVEHHLGGTHKTLKCGITDVTTDTIHAEVKRWDSYKAGVGQLVCYNHEDPRSELHMYLFGPVSNKQTDNIVEKLKNMNIKPFTFDVQPDSASIVPL